MDLLVYEVVMKARTMTDRLEAVFDIVPNAESIADIGTDHGYLAVELIVRGKAKRVIAGDVHKGPLESAKFYVTSRGLNNVIDCRLGDGLQVTKKGELNGAICCGMGGFLMRDIVENGPEPLEFYVLQPQNGQAELRQYMVEKGYRIVKEIIMKDMGKMYTAFVAVRSDCIDTYGDNASYSIHSDDASYSIHSDDALYDTLPKTSILWSAGALLAKEKPALWNEYVDFLIYQRQCALDGMTVELSHTEKYKQLQHEIDELASLR